MEETTIQVRTQNSDRDEAAKIFALELVELARKHGANRLSMTFDMTGHTADWRVRDRWDHGQISLNWSNGRHGAKSEISLRYESSVRLLEGDHAANPSPSKDNMT